MKYLHHEAKVFDIGIYFEANGHGTVLFKPSLLQRLQDMEEQVGATCSGQYAIGRVCGGRGIPWWLATCTSSRVFSSATRGPKAKFHHRDT